MQKSGFTLVEMMVALSVAALISGVILADFGKFRTVLALSREAGVLGLTVRKAQQYAVAVRRFEGDGDPSACEAAGSLRSESEFPAYGVTFSLDDTSSRGKYGLYADPNCNRIAGDYANDLIENIKLGNGIQVDEICTNIDSPADIDCEFTAFTAWYLRQGTGSRDTMVLSFQKGTGEPIQRSNAKIILTAPDLSRKSVIIRTTGQISIQNEK